MKKELRTIGDGVVRITTVDERFYARQGTNQTTGLPEMQFVPSVTWITSFFPKGVGFYKWLANTGWDESQAIRNAAGDKGSRVHHAIVDLLDGGEVSMEAKYAGSENDVAELSLEEYGCLMSFVEWWKLFQPVTVAREVTVFSEEHGYAGTVDWVGEFKTPPKGVAGGLWLLDWKTSQDVWPEHEIQVSAYKQAYQAPVLTPYVHPTTAMVVNAGWATPPPPLALGILQLGYRRNKTQKWKLTPVQDQFDLFLAAQKIWAYECAGQAPAQKDYPLALKLTP